MIVFDMPSSEYHDNPALGSSGLKILKNKTPLHFYAAMIDPDREQEDKKHFRIGRAWHCAVFEPVRFCDEFTTDHDAHPATNRAKLLRSVLDGEIAFDKCVAMPVGLSKTSKEGKALFSEIAAAGNVPVEAEDYDFVREWLPKLYGKTVLPAEQIDGVREMAAIAQAMPLSAIILSHPNGHAEASIFATMNGATVKIRPDWYIEPCEKFPNGLIVDGKSTTDAAPEVFARQAWNLDYGLQAAFYTAVFQQEFRTKERPPFLWLAQEKTAPFAAKYYAAAPDMIAYYDRLLPQLIATYQRGIENDYWPGYTTDVQDLTLPVWAQREVDGVAA